MTDNKKGGEIVEAKKVKEGLSQAIEDIKEAAEVMELDPDLIIMDICRRYSRRYLEYVKGERDEL